MDMTGVSADTGEVLERLVSAKLGQCDSILERWYGPAALRTQLAAWLSNEVERLDSEEFSNGFAEHCPVLGATPSDYRNRWLRVPGFGWALTGIRFWGLDLNRPFVAIVASTKLPTDQADLASAVASLRSVYSLFTPKHVRLFLPPRAPLQPVRTGQFWEKRFLAGRIGRLRSTPKPGGYDRLTLSAAPDTSFYPRYQKAFQDLLVTSPQHSEYTRLESEEDLAELTRHGRLFEIFADDRWAGVTAVDRECEEGLLGYWMVEIILESHARGRGLGAAVQRQLIEWLPSAPGETLFGTIDSRNLAAIAAASRVGRTDIGGYFWTPV
ncbi:MAG: GNAT family protein [Trueperaceae bacterium]